MNIASAKISRCAGSTLVESSIAMGILALAVPLVFGSMAEAGKSGASAEAETRSAWIVPACIQEVENSRAGIPQYFTATEAGQILPPANEIWALAFSNTGSIVGKVSTAQYDNGIRDLDGKTISHLANISAEKPEQDDGMIKLHITLEYPATAPSDKRKKLHFHSLIP